MLNVIMFPGQGSQKIGMGAEVFERYSDLTQQASAQMGYDLKTLCLTGPEELLNNTLYTQPALYVVNALSYLALKDQGQGSSDLVLGHSLGEYNALFAAEAFDFLTGLKLVQKRASLMSQAKGGGMAAILGLSPEQVQDVLRQNNLADIDMANINTPAQIVVSGPAASITAALPHFQNAGARRAIPLSVSGAFHSRYMQEAANQFAEFLKSFSFQPLRIPVIANCTAEPYAQNEIGSLLSRQITHSVRWVESVATILAKDPEAVFTECGPGTVLTGLIKQNRKG